VLSESTFAVGRSSMSDDCFVQKVGISSHLIWICWLSLKMLEVLDVFQNLVLDTDFWIQFWIFRKVIWTTIFHWIRWIWSLACWEKQNTIYFSIFVYNNWYFGYFKSTNFCVEKFSRFLRIWPFSRKQKSWKSTNNPINA